MLTYLLSTYQTIKYILTILCYQMNIYLSNYQYFENNYKKYVIQVKFSAEQSKKCLKEHFKWLEEKALENLRSRLNELLSEVDVVTATALTPLMDCEEMLNSSISAAARIMEEGTR